MLLVPNKALIYFVSKPVLQLSSIVLWHIPYEPLRRGGKDLDLVHKQIIKYYGGSPKWIAVAFLFHSGKALKNCGKENISKWTEL